MEAEVGALLLDDGDWSARDVDFLASWITGDDDVGDDSTSSSASAASVSSDRNPTRQRQREEIAYLRSRSEELERELAMLRGRSPTTEVATSRESEWEAIAKRQQRARTRTQVENAKLREMLASQLKVARTLERLLRKRESVLALDSGDRKKQRRASPPIDSDRDVFDRLLSSIDRSYAETAVVLAANELGTAPRGHRRVEIKHTVPGESGQKLYVEMTDVTTFPFAMEATASASWRCITGGYMQVEHEVYREFAGQDNVLAIKYAVTLARRRLHVDLTARAAMKRFVEHDQIVDVWESISDTSGTHTSPNGDPGVRVRERGWTIVRCADGDPRRTLQLTCMQMIPLVSYNQSELEKSSEDRQVGLLTNLALDYYGDQIDHAQHAMENLLLDEDRNKATIAQLLPK